MSPHYDHYQSPSPTLHAPRPHHSRHSSHSRSHHSTSRDISPNIYASHSRNPSKDRLSTPRGLSRSATPSVSTPVHKLKPSWPPSPFAEEERRSRARERSPPPVVDPAIAEIKCRGTQDQTPTVIDTRLPPQADFDDLDEEALPELDKRAPAPYAHVNIRSNDVVKENAKQHKSSESIRSDALRGEGKSRRSLSRGSNDTPSSAGPKESQTDKARDSLPPAAKMKARETINSRRSTADGQATAQRPQLDLRKDATVMAGIALDPSQFVTSPVSTTFPRDFANHGRNSDSDHSRPTTPDRPRPRRPLSPGTSPQRTSGRRSPDSSRRSSQSSQPSSRPTSRPVSPQLGLDRPSRNVPGKFDESQPKRPAALADDRTQRTSKLMSSMTPSTADLKIETARPSVRQGPTSPTRPGSSLPYPVDDMAIMPSAGDHRYRPRALDTVVWSGSPSPLSSPSPTTPVGSNMPAPRPGLQRAHTNDKGFPLVNPPAFGIAGMMPMSPTIGSTRPTTPPTCPGSRPVKGFKDWYTLEESTRFNICRACLEANFAGTPFERQFRPVSRDHERKITCDFASPWTQLAWRLDQQRGRRDIRYLLTVADILAAEVPCPGSREGRAAWYTLCDEDGLEVSDFHVCYMDVKLIRALLPRAGKLFERHDRHKTSLQTCDLNSESARFKQYLELLEDVEHEGRTSEKASGLAKHRFREHVQRKLEHPECTRDEPVDHARWHYIHGLPEFTVCRECYSDVVWPQIAANSRVALNFIQTPSRIPAKLGGDMQTCQLYSARMRDIFRKACEKNDFAMLERKAKRRKEEEIGIQADAEAARRELQALKRRGATEALLAQARHHLADVEAVWKKWE